MYTELRKEGIKTMSKPKFKNVAPQMLYIMQNGNTNQYKIGITNNINNRWNALQTRLS